MPDIFIAHDSKKEKDLPKILKQEDKVKVQRNVNKQKLQSPSKNTKFEKEGLAYPKSHEERKNLPGHTHNPLAAFCYFPDFVKFVNQDPKEQVILLLRRHPITNIRWILITLLILPLAGIVFASRWFNKILGKDKNPFQISEAEAQDFGGSR